MTTILKTQLTNLQNARLNNYFYLIFALEQLLDFNSIHID